MGDTLLILESVTGRNIKDVSKYFILFLGYVHDLISINFLNCVSCRH